MLIEYTFYFLYQHEKVVNYSNKVNYINIVFYLQGDWNQILLQSEDFVKATMAVATKDKSPTFSKL